MGNRNSDYYFLREGGEMGKLIRAKDWSKTSLGDPANWPQSLRTMVAVMLDNPFGMYIAWGKEYIQIYNDGYRPILGSTKHPQALGISTRETFAEIWHIIESMFDGVMDGAPVGFPDFMLPLDRNGYIETCYFDFAYSPIRMENGEVGGVLVTVIETTNKKKAEDELKESKDQLQFAIDAAQLGTFDYNPLTNKFSANNRLKEWFGLPADEQIELADAINAISEEDQQRVTDSIKESLNFSSGSKVDVKYTVINPHTKKETVVSTKGRAWFNEQKIAYRLNGTLEDVTEQTIAQQKKSQSESNLKLMIAQAPVAISILRGAEYTVEIANQHALELWGRTEDQVLNKSVLAAIPELLEQGIKELLDDVRNTGNRFATNELPVQLLRNGALESVYINFSYEPLYDEDGKINGIMAIGFDVTPQVTARKKIEESEERYHKLISSSPSAIGILYGEDLVVTIANDAILKIWGKGREIIGKAYFEALPELAEQGYREVFAEVYNTGIPFNAVETPIHILQEGEMSLKYYNFLLYAQRTIDGKINGIGIIATEVTSQALLNNKIRESEQSVRAIVESAPFPIGVYTGKEMRIEFANQSIMDVWGKGNDVVGKLYKEILPELENQQIFDQIQGVYSTGIPFHAKNQRIDLVIDNILKPYYFNYSFTPLVDASGKVYGVMNTAAEVTELNEAKQKVEESEKRFRNSVQQAPLGIAIFRGSEFITEMANENYLLLVDKKEEEFIGRPLFEVLPEVKSLVAPLFRDVVNTGNPFYSPELLATLKRHGRMEQAYFNLVYHPLKEETGEISGIMVVATEVTKTVTAKHLLEESEIHFRNMVMQSPIPMTILRGKDYIIESANTVMIKEIWRKSEDEVMGKSILEVFPELKKQKYPELLHKVFTSGETHNEKESVALVEGNDGLKKFYLDFQYAPLLAPHGSVIGIMITVNDVTDKVEARIKIEENQERLNLVIDASELGVWEYDVKTQESTTSERFLEIFGFPGETHVPHEKLIARIHPDDLAIRNSSFEKAFKMGVLHYETRVVWNDKMRWVEVKGKVFYDSSNAPEYLLGTLRDISEERNFQQLLIEREEKFRLLADSMPQHIWTSDPEGNLNYFNQSVYNFSGFTQEQIDKDGWIQIVHPEDREENIKKWTESISTGKDFLIEHRFRRHDGEYRWQLSRAIPQKDLYGKIKMWVGTSTDIQEQKMFVNKLEEQVFERTKELNNKNDDLEKMNKELQAFAYISSHDLQEPLRKIQTFATLITEKESQNLSESGKDKFQRMRSAANRMQVLIQDLLAYSRTTTQEGNFRTTNLEVIIDEVKEDLKEELEQKNAVIELGGMCEVKVIHFQFRQLLFNLVSNSLKFSTDERPIRIKISCESSKGAKLNIEKKLSDISYCHITVEDNGIGFEQQYNEKIFEVFQRLHGKEKYDGTGIGLAIVKKIVDNHNGVITAKGELNKGARFDIYIPIS